MNKDFVNLRQLDLNLLVLFDVLMRERNVSRAAQRVFLSQPAMSNALGRLRSMLDDPVLVRTSRGMEPTPRAFALEGPVRSLLDQMEWQLRPADPFDATTTTAQFTIAMTDYGENLVLPLLAALFREQAPYARLETLALGQDLPVQALERGEVQLLLGVESYLEPNKRLRFHPWIKDRLVCLVNPLRRSVRRGRMSLKQFLDAQHIYPSPLGVKSNIVESWLAYKGESRQIAVTTRSYLAAAQVLKQTDYILSLPERVAVTLAGAFDLEVLEPPRGFPAFALDLIWHPRFESEPSQQWFIAQMKRLGEKIETLPID